MYAVDGKGIDDVTQARGTLADRWPTALGIAVVIGANLAIVLDDGAVVETFGPAVVAMAGIYLVAYAIGRPWTVWIGFGALSLALGVFQVLDDADVSWADPAIGMVVIAVLLWVWAIARGRVHEHGTFWLQTAGMVAFAAFTLVAALIDPRWGAAVAGVGFIAHGAWDAYHFKINKVVSRPYAEFCAVIDFGVGPALIIAALAA